MKLEVRVEYNNEPYNRSTTVILHKYYRSTTFILQSYNISTTEVQQSYNISTTEVQQLYKWMIRAKLMLLESYH